MISEKALFHSRDRVRIKAGPFADHEGVIEKVDKRGVPIVTTQLFGGATFPIDACYLELLVRRQDRPKDKRDKRRTRRLSVARDASRGSDAAGARSEMRESSGPGEAPAAKCEAKVEKKEIGDDQKAVMAEAKAAGFDTKILRHCIKVRTKKPADYHEAPSPKRSAW